MQARHIYTYVYVYLWRRVWPQIFSWLKAMQKYSTICSFLYQGSSQCSSLFDIVELLNLVLASLGMLLPWVSLPASYTSSMQAETLRNH